VRTGKGFNFRPDLVPTVIKALQEAEAAVVGPSQPSP